MRNSQQRSGKDAMRKKKKRLLSSEELWGNMNKNCNGGGEVSHRPFLLGLLSVSKRALVQKFRPMKMSLICVKLNSFSYEWLVQRLILTQRQKTTYKWPLKFYWLQFWTLCHCLLGICLVTKLSVCRTPSLRPDQSSCVAFLVSVLLQAGVKMGASKL